MGRRTLLLIASILVAAVGTALIFLYVRGADDRAKGDAAMVTVVVAKSDIPKNVAAKDLEKGNYITAEKRPAGTVPPGAFTQIADVLVLGAQSTVAQIRVKDIIDATDFAGADQAATAGIPNGAVAQSIQLADPNRVAGIIKPGVKVAVIATFTSASKKQSTEYLMSGITVISVGSDGVPSGSVETVAPAIIDLAVSQQQAIQLRHAEQAGELSLVVLGDGVQINDGETYTGDPTFVPNP